MSNEDIKKRLYDISVINLQMLTNEDKEFVANLSEQMGVEFTPKTNCKDCYREQAIVLYNKIRKGEDDVPMSERKYQLPVGHVLNFFGHMITNEELTDTLAESIIARGFSKDLFICKED